jgi:hypothetical protein
VAYVNNYIQNLGVGLVVLNNTTKCLGTFGRSGVQYLSIHKALSPESVGSKEPVKSRKPFVIFHQPIIKITFKE